MRTPREIYTAYRIMPNLQLHQLRVTAVAKIICDDFKEPIRKSDVILACLFHDMGNILKFDLTVFPDALKPEGIGYWEAVKREYEEKYGTDQHAATLAVAKEIGLSPSVIDCIDVVAFSKAEQTFASGSWEQKICEYADSRVSPTGVLSLEERLREARKRYEGRKKLPDIAIVPADKFEQILAVEQAMEAQIFTHCSVTPADITDASVTPLIQELWEYPVA